MARDRYLPRRLEGDGPDNVTPFPSRGPSRGEFRRFTVGAPLGPAPEAPPDPVQQQLAETMAQAREEGFAAGMAQVEQEMAQQLERWRASVAQAATLRASLTEVHRREMVELAVAVASAVIQRDVTEHTVSIEQAIGTALEQLGTRERVHITLGPTDADRLNPWLDELREQGLDVSAATDPNLSPGDMKVSSAAGSVEHLLKERIERVRQLVVGSETPPDQEAPETPETSETSETQETPD